MPACMRALCLAVVLAIPGAAAAQVSTTGAIHVVVEDANGGRVAEATVTARAADTLTTRRALTDARGVAILDALAPSADYTVSVTRGGFRDATLPQIRVSSGSIATVNARITLAAVAETLTVAGTAPTIDVRRALSGQDITLRLAESLPTGRSYQSYLQLVPGVLPDSQTQSGNPSSRSGVNWADLATNGNLAVSTDNQYYFEGINVTDPYTGTFGANLNTEIIQEQKVLTGGLPAEYVGTPGLISTVVTKSGSNRYAGSINYFFQNDTLIARSAHTESSAFSSRDTAFTLGGPVLRDRLWAFGSFRYIGRTEDVTAQDTRAVIRRVRTTQSQGFAKGTFAPTPADLLTVTFLNDPLERDGAIDPTVVASRNRQLTQGGSNVALTYRRSWSALLLEGALNLHDAELSDRAANTAARNTVAFRTGDARTLTDEQLGGYGQTLVESRPTTQANVAAQWQRGGHVVKGGFQFAQREVHRDLSYLGEDHAQYTSIAARYGGVTAFDIATGAWSTRAFRASSAGDFQGLISQIDARPDRAAFYAAYDTNGNGAITALELAQALSFDSTAGNPDGQINYSRTWMSATGPQDLKTRGRSFYVQDEFTFDRLSFNLGVRAEDQAHYATTGARLHRFDWVWAPRVSAAYDVTGSGRQKIATFYGRYYDPVRLDVTAFAGTLTGPTQHEQIYVDGQWITYRTRGFDDGSFTPTTKVPYTDEWQVQHEIDLGRDMSLSSTFWMRWTKNIFEDFDLHLYGDPDGYTSSDGIPGPVDHPQSLFLGYDYFGLDPDAVPASNYFLGTVPEAYRRYRGAEFVFRKRFSDRWQTLASYNWVDSKGNATSDGDADYQGDLLFLDPRAPNMVGTVPGTIHHLVKTAASYAWPFGLEVGGTYRWNSGTVVNRTFLLDNRRLPVESEEPFEFAGMTDYWVAPGTVGAVRNPGNGSLDLRVQYVRRFPPVTAEFFLDVFNVLDDQAATRVEDLVSGTGSTAFGDAIQWLQPRRAFLGARLRF